MNDEKPGGETDESGRPESSRETILHQYESLLQSIDGIVWEAVIKAGAFEYTFVNDKAEKILGYPVEQWFSEPDFWINHLHPADREATINFCRVSVQNRQDHQFECRVISADGRIVWLRDIVSVKAQENDAVYLRGVMVDITERVRATEELRSSDMRMRALLEQVPAIVWSTDRDLRYTHMAGRMLSLLNIPEGRNMGVSLYEYFQTDDPDFKPIAAHRRALAGESLTYDIDWKGYIFDAYVEPLRNAVGEIVGCVGIALDVTRRKRAEESMQREQRLTEAMFESLPGVFYLFNKEGKYLRWNKNYEDVTGYSAEEIAKKHPLDYVDGEERPVAMEKIGEVFERGQSSLETSLKVRDGTLIPYLFTGSRVSIDEQECLIGMGIDITDRKRAEDENRKLIHLLGERVKELTMLHKTARILQHDEKSVAELLGEIAYLIPQAWQYPEVTAGRITFGDLKFETGGFTASSWSQRAEFDVASVPGSIDVVYLEERPAEDEGPFSAEERKLIDSLSEMISSALNRRRAREELHESQRRFSDTLVNLEMMAVMADNAGTILFCNDYLLRVTGWERGEVIGQNWFDMFLPDHEKGRVENILVEVGHEQDIVPHFENEIKTRAGGLRMVKWTNTTLRDLEGNVTGVAALGNDVTERGHFERELIRSEERYRSLVENAHDIIYTQDLEGNYTSINKAGEQIIGYTREEVLTMNSSQIIAPEYWERARRMVASKLAGEKETIYELQIIAKNGRRVALEVNTRLVYQDRAPVGIQGIARDVTERLHLEEQLRQAQKMEAVGRLAGGIAHDFNNMLTVINGYSELILRKTESGDPIRSKIEEIRKAGESSASLTHQLLAFSRKQVLQPKVLDLNEVVRNTKGMFQRLIGEHIEVTTVLKPDLGNIKADPGQIGQVIMNLAVNARDAMPRGGKLVIETGDVYLDEESVTHHILAKQGEYVRLTVTDSGPGMDGDTVQHIFEPFYTTKEMGKGTGLGLATVYGIVKQSGGHISVDSVLGRGTTFEIYLPVIEEGAEEYKPGPVSDASLRGRETVLLIEDEEIVRKITHEVLRSYGYEVLEAAGCDEALAICENHERPVRLLVTDVIMPGMSGPELAGKLLDLCPDMKVLYISGYTDDAIVHHGVLDTGINFLQKPFTPVSLARKIREVLDKTEG